MLEVKLKCQLFMSSKPQSSQLFTGAYTNILVNVAKMNFSDLKCVQHPLNRYNSPSSATTTTIHNILGKNAFIIVVININLPCLRVPDYMPTASIVFDIVLLILILILILFRSMFYHRSPAVICGCKQVAHEKIVEKNNFFSEKFRWNEPLDRRTSILFLAKLSLNTSRRLLPLSLKCSL